MEEKIPKDLKVKVGTKLEAMWSRVENAAKMKLEESEQTILIQKAVIEMANKKVKEEQDKNKSKS